MFRYFSIALRRNLLRNKAFTFLNITGLSIGIACCLLLVLYIQYELSYDKQHEGYDRIYRVLSRISLPSEKSEYSNITPIPMADEMNATFPEVISLAKIVGDGGLLRYEDKAYEAKSILSIDSSFFDVFNFPVLFGSPRLAVQQPNTVILTEKLAKLFFGDDNPIGKTIKLGTIVSLNVGAIIEDIPENSHLQFDCLISSERKSDDGHTLSSGSSLSFAGNEFGKWTTFSGSIYFKLAENTDSKIFIKNFYKWAEGHYKKDQQIGFKIQALTDIQLGGDVTREMGKTTNIRNVYFLIILAVLILLIACFNYINLSTARASKRLKEVALKKILGVRRSKLIRQFLYESILISVLSFIVSFGLVELFLPTFNNLIDKNLSFFAFGDIRIIAGALFIAIVLGVIAGLYPALFLSSFKPLNVLKGQITTNPRSTRIFRNSLVVAQNVISIILIIGTIVVYSQLNFITKKDLGYQTKNIIAVNLRDYKPLRSINVLKQELLSHSNIIDITSSLTYPTAQGGGASRCWWEGQEQGSKIPYLVWTNVEYNFFDFYDMQIIKGRGFSEEHRGEDAHAYVLNEAALKMTGWENPIGKKFGIADKEEYKGTVIGVVKDFHFNSLRDDIEPLAISLASGITRSIAVKVSGDDIRGTIAFMNSIWPKYSIFPFSYNFLEDMAARHYDSERKLTRVLMYFAIMAIVISCLGILGLATYASETRIKEIGIRKIMGASVLQIISMLLRQFLKWVVLANVFAWPIAYYVISRWLENYAYRINVNFAVFVLAGISAMILGLLAIGYQTFRAAGAKPVDILKHE